MRDVEEPTTVVHIYKLDLLAGWPSCQWRLHACKLPSAYRLQIFGEDRSFLMCRQHMERPQPFSASCRPRAKPLV
jgi:hypothetical protein